MGTSLRISIQAWNRQRRYRARRGEGRADTHLKLYHFDFEDSPGAPSGQRAAKIERFVSESLADCLVAAGREVPEALARGEPPAMRKGPHGKPYLEGSGLEGVFFSLSHTRGHAIVCFSGGEIGADCENMAARPGGRTRYEGIAARCFAGDERGYIGFGQPGDTRRFFEIWTMKEAYMKYTGRGFAEGIRSFSVLDTPPGVNIKTGLLDGAPHVVFSVCTGTGGAGATA